MPSLLVIPTLILAFASPARYICQSIIPALLDYVPHSPRVFSSVVLVEIRSFHVGGTGCVWVVEETVRPIRISFSFNSFARAFRNHAQTHKPITTNSYPSFITKHASHTSVYSSKSPQHHMSGSTDSARYPNTARPKNRRLGGTLC